MLELLNTKIFDNERNILNADLFVNNLKHTFKAFKFNTKITYEVYRNITIYHITWNDDKSYEDMLELKKEIALALGVTTNEFEIEKEKENEVKIKVQNMKKSTLSLKELLEESKDKDNNNIPLGLSEEDKVIYFNIEKDKNLLVTGVTGIGKTNLFNNIILNILMNKDKTKIIILDSQSINYNAYDKLCEVVNNEQEIINKIKEIRHIFEEKVKNNEISIEDINEQLISDNLYTAGQPDPDLLIRTSRELRTSNFLPWQLVYTEFYFPDKHWPEFGEEDLLEAIRVYQKRNRRFGGRP